MDPIPKDTIDKETQNSWESLTDTSVEVSPEKAAAELATTELGSRLHDVWREPRRLDDGGFEPREKKTSDQAWIEAHGTNVVDIANTDFADLPQDWKQENEDAARVVVGLFHEGGVPEKLPNDKGEFDTKVRELASKVHDAWLSRENNSWAKGGELDVPFDELSEAEQQKYIEQVLLGISMADADNEIAWRTEEGDYSAVEVYGYNKYGKLVYFDTPEHPEDF